eukprot:1205516-Amphidinium_carterae.2
MEHRWFKVKTVINGSTATVTQWICTTSFLNSTQLGLTLEGAIEKTARKTSKDLEHNAEKTTIQHKDVMLSCKEDGSRHGHLVVS